MKLSVILEAIDRVTAPARKAGEAVRKLGTDLGFQKVTAAAGRVGTSFNNVAKEARSMALRVSAAVGFMGGGLLMLVKRTAAGGDAALKASQRIGVSIESYQRLGHAAKMAGSSQEDMGSALSTLNQKIVAAARGNQEAAITFARLKVSIRDGDGKIKNTERLFGEISDRFARLPDGVAKSAAAMAVFGGAGESLLPTLNLGSKGLRAAGDEAERLGVVMSRDGAKASSTFMQSLTRLTASVSGVVDVVSEKLMPVLGPLMQRLTDWIIANRELIATRVQKFLEELPSHIAAIRDTLRQAYERMIPVIDAVQKLVQWIGPANSVLLLLAGVIAGPLIIALGQLIWTLGVLGKALAFTSIQLGKLVFVPVIAAIGNFITAIRAGYGVMAAFNLVLAANPIGLVIIAITALAGAAYLIYKNWGAVSAWFGKLFNSIKKTFKGLLDFVVGVFTLDFGRALDGITGIFGGIIGSWSATFDLIKALFNGLVSWIDKIFGTSIGGYIEKLGRLKDSMSFGRFTIFGDNGDKPAINGTASRGSMGSTNIGAAGVPVNQRVQAGGELRVRIDSEGRPRVASIRSDNPRIPITANVGRVMG